MSLTPQEIQEFSTYRPRSWQLSRKSGSGEFSSEGMADSSALPKRQLTEPIVLGRVPGKRFMRQILLLYFLIFVLGGAVYLGMPNPNTAIGSIMLLFAIIGSMVLTSIYHSRSRYGKPKSELILTQTSLSLIPTGEFIWGNIAAIRCLPYADGGGFVLLLLSNGTIVEHKIRPVDENCSLNGRPTNLAVVFQTILQYWYTNKN